LLALDCSSEAEDVECQGVGQLGELLDQEGGELDVRYWVCGGGPGLVLAGSSRGEIVAWRMVILVTGGRGGSLFLCSGPRRLRRWCRLRCRGAVHGCEDGVVA
jgi:hypothetical protein